MSETTANIKAEQPQKVPLKEKLFFGSADMFGGGAQALISAVYLVFLVNNGVSIELAGLIVMASKIWDAVTDPLMGIISDNTRTKWGRRRPYIFLGAFLFIPAFALLFLPLYSIQIQGLKFSIYLVSYCFYMTVSTIISVSYSSLSTEISTDIDEKTRINSIRLLFSMVSSGISALAPILLIEQLQNRAINIDQFSLIIILAFGALYAIPLFLCAIFSKERVPISKEKKKFSIKTFVKPLKVKVFVYFLLSYLFSFTCMDIITANIVFFADYGLKLGKSSSILLIIIMLSYAAVVPVHYKLLSKGFAKPKLFRMGIPLYILGIICICLYPAGAPFWPVPIFCVIIGVGMSGCQLIPWILFPDVVDVGELKLKERIAGSFSGIMTFIRKASSAIAIAITSWVLGLDIVGFREPVTDYLTGTVTKFEQPESAVWGLRMIVMVPVIVFISLAFFFSAKTKLTKARSQKIKEFIELQNKGELDIEKLSEADREEYLKIQKELF